MRQQIVPKGHLVRGKSDLVALPFPERIVVNSDELQFVVAKARAFCSARPSGPFITRPKISTRSSVARDVHARMDSWDHVPTMFGEALKGVKRL